MRGGPRIRWPAWSLVELVRGTSAVVQLFWVFFVLPLIGLRMPALLAATGAKTVGFGRRAPNRGTKQTSPSGGEFVDRDFVPDIPLADSGRLEGDGWAMLGKEGEGFKLMMTKLAQERLAQAIRSATVVHALRRKNLKYGMVTMCVGTGQGAAGIFERV